MTDSAFDLHQVLLATEEAMKAILGGARVFVGHEPSKGTISEEAWRRVIDKFLPARYTTSTNVFVVGADGGISQQIDLAIHDAHFCPLFFEDGGVRFIPSESVFGVFDCKQEINATTLSETVAKVASVRAIGRTNRQIVERGEERPPRTPFEIVGGILALTSGWTSLLGETLHSNIAKQSRNPGRLDLGCALAEGAFEIRFRDYDDPQIDGTDETPLTFLLMRLFSILQAIGSPMAIDLRAYSSSVEDLNEIPDQ